MSTDRFYKKKIYGCSPSVYAVSNRMTTEQIQKLIRYAGVVGGGTIHFQPGLYNLEPLAVLHSDVHIVGSGIGVTVLRLKDSPTAEQGALITFSYDDNSAVTYNNSISNLSIDGNKANQLNGSDAAEGTNSGISIRRVTRFVAEDLLIYNCDGYGILSAGTGVADRADITISNVEVFGSNYDNIDIKSGAERITLQNVRSYNTSGGNIPERDSVGIDLRGEYVALENVFSYGNVGYNLRLRSNATGFITGTNIFLYGSTQSGLYLDGPASLTSTWTNLHCADNDVSGIVFNSGHHSIVNPNISGNASMGILVNTAANTVLSTTGGFIQGNALDGINCNAATDATINIQGTIFKDNLRRAIDMNKGKVVWNGGAAIDNGGSTHDAIYFEDLDANSLFNGISITGNGGHAFRFDGAASSGSFRVIGCDLSGNGGADNSGAYTGTLPTNLKALGNIGLADI
jgi:hypothetical protein